jgi:hypothetical protein
MDHVGIDVHNQHPGAGPGPEHGGEALRLEASTDSEWVARCL